MKDAHKEAADVAERLSGRVLYSWQRRLLTEHFMAGDVPPALDVPTGLGKTLVMTLWLSALASGAPLPRRLVYVVDRRAVVDQATVEAEALAAAPGDGVHDDAALQEIRTALGLERGDHLLSRPCEASTSTTSCGCCARPRRRSSSVLST